MRAPLSTLILVWSMPLLSVGGCAESEPEIADWCSVPLVGEAPPITRGNGGIIYEIYVRSFRDSDGDGVGDLRGVIEKLDHLQQLGVDTIWLMPIFESPSVAGYNPSDFNRVDADYGTDDDLDALLAEAADRDMRVILDVAINHTSDTHPWFKAARAHPDGAAADRYLFSGVQWDDVRWWKAGEDAYYYAFFGADHPDLNWGDPAVPTAIRDALVGWLDRGVSGFRLDAVVQLVEEDGEITNTAGSHCAMAWLYRELKAARPDALILSEAWSQDAAENLGWLGTAQAPEADLVIDVPRRYDIIDAWRDHSVLPLLETMDAAAAAEVSDRVAPYINAHDLPRLPTLLEDPAARRAWMVLHLLGAGMPVLLYGDEIDLPDSGEAADQDYPQRAPMLWDDTYNAGFTSGQPWFPVDTRYLDGLNVAVQAEDPYSPWSLAAALGALRSRSVALREGGVALLPSTDPGTLQLMRRAGDEVVLLIVNLSNVSAVSPVLMVPPEYGPWTDLTGGEVEADQSGRIALGSLKPWGYRVLVGPGLADGAVPGPL